LTRSAWRLLHTRGPAASLFAPQDYAGAPTVVSCAADSDALVLGSTQPWVDAAGSVPVARRRSGGGAVLVGPGHVVWVDVFVPRGHAVWDDDVGRAFWWLGDAWAGALGALGVVGLAGRVEVHRGPLVTTQWSGAVCFAGLGPGEVTIDGAKTVGMAQRRTRDGALFQCAVALDWQPERMAALLALAPNAAFDLAGAVHPIGPLTPDDCTMALLDYLP
jgi:lipoate-protein ligase A